MRDLHLYVPNKGTYMTSQPHWRMRKYFSTIGKSYYWLGTKHRGYGFGEWIFFWWRSISMHVHLRILRIYFFRYQENSHPQNFNPENIHQSNSPLIIYPLENSQPENSHLEYSHPSFQKFFFHYCRHYHWYYLTDCFLIICFKSAEVFTLWTFVKTKG